NQKEEIVKDATQIQNNTPSANNTTNNLENPTCENSKSVLDSNNSDNDVENEKAEKHGNNAHANNQPISKKEVHFDTVIELVYYYYSEYFSVNQFYTSLQFCKEFIKKKMPQYEEMLKQYKSEREFCEKQYLLNEQINTLSVFNYTIEKMNDWVDRKTFDALKLIEAELKVHPLEDNRKTHVKKLEEKKEKEETIQKKILNVKPNTIKTSQNIYKGSLLIKINESDISSPFLIIGRNSKQNEKISTQILKFNDLWFHVHQHPGGHVILRNKKINGKIISADLNLSDINIDDDIDKKNKIKKRKKKLKKGNNILSNKLDGSYDHDVAEVEKKEKNLFNNNINDKVQSPEKGKNKTTEKSLFSSNSSDTKSEKNRNGMTFNYSLFSDDNSESVVSQGVNKKKIKIGYSESLKSEKN
ncbi:FbpA domain protein, putative, partial [Plasmodium ovale curtisi]